MLIWSIFFVVMLIFAIVLIFYLNVELNEMDKKVSELASDLEKHYEN
ncbi:hypothetical protein CHISP_2477 [Chitinispirillum alkaliphilum]|nr:hypothetical protein CHISP_2477 [Chitinispirillum alkaliphilum]